MPGKTKEELAKIGVEHRFTSTNQPSPEAKSKGKKAGYDRRNLKNDMVREVMKQVIKIKGTDEIKNPLEYMGMIMAKFMTDPKVSEKEKLEVFNKWAATVGIKDTNIQADIKGNLADMLRGLEENK